MSIEFNKDEDYKIKKRINKLPFHQVLLILLTSDVNLHSASNLLLCTLRSNTRVEVKNEHDGGVCVDVDKGKDRGARTGIKA